MACVFVGVSGRCVCISFVMYCVMLDCVLICVFCVSECFYVCVI